MRYRHITAVATIALCSAASAAEPDKHHRELGAHVHGHGTLNLAVEDKRVAIELEVPGMDIVGFEHRAESAEQKAAITKATELLSQPLALFALPAAAGCRVESAKVALEGEHGHGHGHEGGPASGPARTEEDGHDDKDDHADHHHDHDHERHNSFEATYDLACDDPARLTSIRFDYFAKFAGARNLTVNVVTAKGQSTYEVSRDKPELDLGGVM